MQQEKRWYLYISKKLFLIILWKRKSFDKLSLNMQ